MKLINCQNTYDVEESVYPHIAFNQMGIMCGFQHAPVRDFENNQWVDSVTGSTGEMILFGKWDQSAREVSTLVDMRKHAPGIKKFLKKKGKV
jgi:hypothetical protein